LARNENWGDFQTTDLNNPERIVVQLAGTPEAQKAE
jgi:hypothetical protein